MKFKWITQEYGCLNISNFYMLGEKSDSRTHMKKDMLLRGEEGLQLLIQIQTWLMKLQML